jgi:hypothetical protein
MVWIAIAVPVIFSAGFLVGTAWASLVISGRREEATREREFWYKLG